MTQNIKQKVLAWCKEERIFKEEPKDENAKFNFIVNYPERLPHMMNIVQPKERDDRVLILCITNADPALIERMKSTPKKEMDEFMWDVRFALGNRPTEFEIKYSDGVFESYIVTAPIYLDGLSKNAFMTALREVYKSKLLVIWKLQQKFGEV